MTGLKKIVNRQEEAAYRELQEPSRGIRLRRPCEDSARGRAAN
jgi:hypothetical protein